MHFLQSVILVIAILIGSPVWAIDDSDLSDPRGSSVFINVPIQLSPDQIKTDPSSNSAEVEVLREDHGKWVPIIGLPITLSPSGEGSTHVEVVLKNRYFQITNGRENYSIVAEIPPSGRSQLFFRSDSNGGQALGIWQVAQRAQEKLGSQVGLDFWRNPSTFVWPDEADYYSFGQIHVTRGDHWDVVGHELGHAIYDLGKLGILGGGVHKIDECYSQDLALSEGWASFFSAWLSVDLSDPDAQFEFMVPRRAPIRFETIPSDVCIGETNEWRVTGFFWDLLDLHEDGEKSQEAFSRVWQSMKGSRVNSASAARGRLKSGGFDPDLLQIAWDLNFGK